MYILFVLQLLAITTLNILMEDSVSKEGQPFKILEVEKMMFKLFSFVATSMAGGEKKSLH